MTTELIYDIIFISTERSIYNYNMEYTIIILLLLIIGIFIFYNIKDKRNLKNYKESLDNETKSIEEKYQAIIQEIKEDKSNKLANELTKKWELEHNNLLKEVDYCRCVINSSNERLNKLKIEIAQKQEFNASMLQMRTEELNRLMEEKQKAADIEFQHKKDNTTKEIEEWTKSAQEAATEVQIEKRKELQSELESTQQELDDVRHWLYEYQQKQESINKEILRHRQLAEKEDFYRIQLSDSSKQDISYLISILDHFVNKEVIYKLIWSEYIQRPFKALLNRTLPNRDPRNVIYMIKNIITQEIYIGRTKSEISKRWTDHIKSSLSIGGTSNAAIHKALYNHWDDFTFSILEEVDSDDKLSERERYYINFYQSDIYGYNLKAGG